MVASVIIRQRRLRNPRNTFWLGVIFCNLLAFANALIEYAAYEMLSITACYSLFDFPRYSRNSIHGRDSYDFQNMSYL